MKKRATTMLQLTGLMLLSSAGAAQSVSIEQLQAKSSAQIKLYVLDCGTVKARDLSVFNPIIEKGTKMEMAVPCYLIKHPSKGTMVWDAGLSDSIASEKDGIEFYDGVFNLSVKKTMLSQLAEVGVKPTQVTYFAPSHLHVDHSGNANYFADSTLLMQQAEYQVAFSKDAANYGFDINNYSALRDAKRIPLQGDHDVFGDGSAIILSTPGHSPGHQSLYLKLPETGPVILSGDLYHFHKNRQEYGIPVWNDKKSTISSFAKIDNILDNTAAKLWIQHDPEEAKTTRMSPAYYQ
jgi:glyoxylase-like metal-dependent hydrolase (beta-lactamase superfamily II)